MHFTTYLLHRQMEFCWGGNKERKKKFFLNHKLYKAGWVVCMPQRMIVCRGRVQKGDILDSHSFPSVIIQSVLSLRFPNWSFCNSKCSFDHVSFHQILTEKPPWTWTDTQESENSIPDQAALPTFSVWNWIHFTDVWCNLGFCGWCGGARVAVQKLSRSLPNL